MTVRRAAATALATIACGFCSYVSASTAAAAREPVLKQIDLPHSYYYREMYLPQLTSGPSSVAFSPDGRSLVYSMAGSLWRQTIGEDVATELTHGPGYDYQPDWSPDGQHIVFVRHDRNAIQLWQLDVDSGRQQQLTRERTVDLEPRYSPDGKRLAYVSTAGSGHFNLFVADISSGSLSAARTVIAPRESQIARYYYSTHDHAINPAWTPDGRGLVFVSNRQIAYGTGSLCTVAVDHTSGMRCFVNEETSWRARPDVAPDGRRVVYSSYQGRQWHQLWLTTLSGDAALPLTFGDFDATHARWSPDGKRIAYISNEEGDLSLWLLDVVGGKRTRIVPRDRRYLRTMIPLSVQTRDGTDAVAARLSVLGADGRYYGPNDRWLHADDGFDPQRQQAEVRYFHCPGECTVLLPEGGAQITAWRGHAHTPAQLQISVAPGKPNVATLELQKLQLPKWAPAMRTADLHVHMNYGGHYRHTQRSLIEQARAEDLDIVYNLIVNKEQRIPDIAGFTPDVLDDGRVTIVQSQEYHTSFWGHLGLLNLDRLLLPDFSAYQHSALGSPYPHNGVIADLAHEQQALVGYVHPFDWRIDPQREATLTHALPADVALGKVDYMEIVGFSDHNATAEVWYRLLNLGFRIAAGAGTDAMANYASLRGPVGLNRVYLLQERGAEPVQALQSLQALEHGGTVASNGPLLAFEVAAHRPGDTVTRPAGRHRISYRAALRSPVALDRLEVVQNGRVVATHKLAGKRTHADVEGTITAGASGWVLLRAWSEKPDPLIFDLYPYATTSPVYLSVDGKVASSPQDAEYFVAWIDRLIAAAAARTDYNDEREKRDTLEYLQAARAVFEKKRR